MMSVMSMFVIYLVLMNGYHFTEVILKQDNGNSDIDNDWKHVGSCAGAWGWEGTVWATCSLPKGQKCTLTSLYWNISDANVVFLNVSVSVSKCAVLNSRKSKQDSCSDHFQMRAYIGNRSGQKTYAFVSDIPKDPVPTTNDTKFYCITDTISIDNVTGMEGIILQFHTSSFCGQLQKVVVYYHRCPTSVTSALASFESKAAPNQETGSISIDGKCANNTVMKYQNRPVMTCNYDGSYTVSGECICIAGFTKEMTQCKACDGTEYKPTVGNQPCTKCGANSVATVDRLSCVCRERYFRENGKTMNSSTECYRPPDAPKNARVIANTIEYVTLSWERPPNQGSKPLGDYVIKCVDCPGNHNFKTNELSYNLTGLGSFANYTFLIYNENEITKQTSKSLSAVVDFRTKPAAPGPVQNVKVNTNSDGSVLLMWDEPFEFEGSDITYVFRYGENEYRTKKRFYTISTGTQEQSYTIEIYAEVTVDGKVYKGQSVIKESITVKGKRPLGPVIGGSVGAFFVIVVIVLVVAFRIWWKRNPRYLQVVRMEDGTMQLPSRFYNTGKLYVDPTTYNDVDDAVQEFAYELERKDLKFGPLLGGGEFAEVYKGELMKNDKCREVAIKMLKAGSSRKDRDDFLGEAAILGQFTDENVVQLEGVISKDQPKLIVLKFMLNGALDKYLQDNDNQFTILQLLVMARGVSSGMKYLSELGFIHRDLAARNILVDEFNVCKVSDFGLSRELKVDETYDTQGGKIPIRWTAPEAIQYKKFTTSSDVWSYGILLWEIVSYGERPYWNWNNYYVLERINGGYRLPQPMGCPIVVHDLMLSCWNKDRVKRPKFTEIRDQLEKWIKNTDLLKEIASVITKTDEDFDYKVLRTTHEWLEAIGMSRYAGNFIDQGFTTPCQILDMTLDDLEALGVGPIGHRKKIYKAIQNNKDLGAS